LSRVVKMRLYPLRARRMNAAILRPSPTPSGSTFI